MLLIRFIIRFLFRFNIRCNVVAAGAIVSITNTVGHRLFRDSCPQQ